MSRTQREGRRKTQRLGHRTLPVFMVLLASLTLAGCGAIDALKDLTEPALPTSRSLSLRVTPDSLPDGGGEVTLEATVQIGETTEAGIPVTFHSTGGTFPGGSEANTDSDGVARVALIITNTVEVKASLNAGGITVTESVPTMIETGAGGGVAAGNVRFDISTDPNSIKSRDPATISITASDSATGAWAKGRLLVEFGDGKQVNLASFDRKAELQHTYKTLGSFDLTVVLTEEGGRESSRTVPVRVKDGTVTALEFSASKSECFAREDLEFTIRLSLDNSRSGRGNVVIEWGDGKVTRVGNVVGTAKAVHQYRDKGSYKAQATVTTETGSRETGSFRIRVDSPISIDGTLSGSSSITTGSASVFTFTADRSDGARPTGQLVVSFGDGSDAQFHGVSSASTRVSHTYATDDNYQIKADYTDDDGRTAKDTFPVTATAASGGGGGDGDGGGGGGGSDEISAGGITYLHADVSNWSVTSTTTKVTVDQGQICIFHSKAGKWRAIGGLEGNPWIVANVGGQWYAATWEWLRPGQTCKKIEVPQVYPNTARALGPHIKKSPLASWVPKKGETVYFFSSTFARDSKRTTNERSNMVKVIWPY